MSIVSNRDNLYLGYYLHYSTPGCRKSLLREPLPFEFLGEKREYWDREFELARLHGSEPEFGQSISEYFANIREDKHFPIIFVDYYHRSKDYEREYYMVIRYETHEGIFGIGRKFNPNFADLQERCLKIYNIKEVNFDIESEKYFHFHRSEKKIYYNDYICSSIWSLEKVYYWIEGDGFIIRLFDKIKNSYRIFLFFKHLGGYSGHLRIYTIKDYTELYHILNQIGTYKSNPWDIIMIEWALNRH